MLCMALLLCGCGKQESPYVPTGDALVPDGPELPTDPVVTQQVLYLAYHPDHTIKSHSIFKRKSVKMV